MLSDDEILDRVRVRASALRRRRRLTLGGSGTLLVTVVLLAGVAVAAGDTGGDVVSTADRSSTTETSAPEETTTTGRPRSTSSSTSTLPSPSTTVEPPLAPPSSTEPSIPSAPSAPVSPGPGAIPGPGTAGPVEPAPPGPPAIDPPGPDDDVVVLQQVTQDGLHLDAVAGVSTVPGEDTVKVTVRLRTARGSHAGGLISWGVNGEEQPIFDGSQPPDSCASDTPDPDAGDLDELVFQVPYTYPGPGRYVIEVTGWVSACYAERVVITVPLAIELLAE